MILLGKIYFIIRKIYNIPVTPGACDAKLRRKTKIFFLKSTDRIQESTEGQYLCSIN